MTSGSLAETWLALATLAPMRRLSLARDTGVVLTPADTRRTLVTISIELPSLVGGWFAVGDALLFGVKRCPHARTWSG